MFKNQSELPMIVCVAVQFLELETANSKSFHIKIAILFQSRLTLNQPTEMIFKYFSLLLKEKKQPKSSADARRIKFLRRYQ